MRRYQMPKIRRFRLVYFVVAVTFASGILALMAHVAVAQSPPSFFTLVFVPDIHWDYLDGSPHVEAQAAWNAARAFIEKHYADSTWNIRGGIDLGDIVSENSVGPVADWTLLASHFERFWQLGMTFLVAPGNHDAWLGSSSYWDTYFAPVIRLWPLAAAMNDSYKTFNPPYTPYTPQAVIQYGRLNVTTSAGAVKLGLASTGIFPTAEALASLKALTDADSDRQILFGTHMFLQVTNAPASTNTDIPCNYNTQACAGANSNGALSGADMWGQLRTWPRLVGILNGHTHGESYNDGVHSARLIGASGNLVQALSTHPIVGGTLILAKFRTDNHTIEWYSWKTMDDAADATAWGAPLVTSWNPLIAGRSAMQVTGVVNAASSDPGPLAGGQIVSVYGSGLGPTSYATGWQKGLGVSRIFFNGIEAWMTLASDGQLNAVVPYGVRGQVNVTVEFNGKSSDPFPVIVGDSSPGIFTWASGPGPAVILDNGGPSVNLTTNPVARGDVITFWATGQGPVTPAGQDGEAISGVKSLTLPYKVTIGGVDAPVQFIGLTYTGVIQVNVVVPPNAPTQTDELVLTIGNTPSKKGVTISVK
jgi:uncharacterized protein (TIGR03437 family)